MKFSKLCLLTMAAFSLAIGVTVTSHASTMRGSDMTYLKTSEKTPYPDLNKYSDLNILVKIKQNRVYIRNGQHTIYTMYCSAGQINKKTGKSDTPTGHFKIQQERGNSFYNKSLKEGANHWTSFKDHGVYLFHSVPTDAHSNYKEDKAELLGKKPDSHGCIRLSVPDSQWFQENMPTGTPVTIVNQ